MLTDPPIEQMLPKAACAYELAVLVSKRASQLVDGAQPMIPDQAANAVSLACREIAQGKVVGVRGNLKKNEFALPLTKEAREAAEAERKAKEAKEEYRRMADSVDAEAELEAQETPESDVEDLFKTEDDNFEGDIIDEDVEELTEE
ncbi:MAG: DNA-directed RNA polymerase subunit omega [Clostridiales bacterium]|nr:DNA-directed RNA polymerase subunit omega [Clostridiales bacterium]